jgi:hypothetical protein
MTLHFSDSHCIRYNRRLSFEPTTLPQDTMMITRTPRALARGSIRSLSTAATRPTCLALPRLAYVVRSKSTIVERSPLHSVPSKAEAVGKPAVDTKKGKVWDSAYEAVQDIKSGSLVLSSGRLLQYATDNADGQVSDYVEQPKLSFRL